MNGEFYIDFVGVCPKGSVEWEWCIEVDFGACEWSRTTMGNPRNVTKLLNVNYAPLPYKLPKLCRTSKNQSSKALENTCIL